MAQSESGRTSHRGVGAQKERAAAEFLRQHGVLLKERNFRSGRTGEIDLVGYDGGTLVFFEVKYRASSGCGAPEEAVTPSKQRAISQTARFYLTKNHISPDLPIRFDVVALRAAGRGADGQERLAVHWIRGAFDYCGPAL